MLSFLLRAGWLHICPLLSSRADTLANTVYDPVPRKGRRPRFWKLRLLFLLTLLALVSLVEPRVFQFVVRHGVALEAWRNGGRAHVRSVEGSLFEPVILRHSTWAFANEMGVVARMDVERARVEMDWKVILKGMPSRIFQRLTLDGVAGKIEVQRGEGKSVKRRWVPPLDLVWLRGRWMPMPSILEARDVNLVIAAGGEFVRLEQARFRVSEQEPGIIKIGKLAVQQSWLKRSFPNVRGTTALQNGALIIARLQLEPGVEVSSLSTNLEKLTRGELEQVLQVDAFGGDIRADAGMKRDEQPRRFSVSGRFSKIDIGQLASFLSLSEAAGGTIKEGNFSFNGSPHDVQQATTWLHLDAANFQWESRQWDSLVLGVTLIDRRLQVHECSLLQGHNALTLDGEMTLPEPGREWWQGDFNANISAKIENMTELSALLLPEFTYAAGRGTIEGAVRGHEEKFQGHLVIEGSKLRWRDAPIEQLNAALRINGNELQVAHLNIFNGEDYVRGNGVVNILGPTQYWGTLRASVADLDTYAAILQKPIVPEPLAGGALIDWDGEGSAKGNSGKFAAHLRKVRSPSAAGAQLHPINADLEGSYAAGGMVFSKFALSDDESSFTANVAVGNMALALQGIRLMHKQQLWLEGDALLPLDVWRKWPNTELDTLLNDDVQSKVSLTAYNLELGTAAKLTGWNFPIAGVVNGNVTAEGPLVALKTGGKLALADGKLPLGASGSSLTEVAGEVTFDGPTVSIARLVGRHPTGDFRAVGKVDLKNLRDPDLQGLIESDKSEVTLFHAVKMTTAVKLQFDGPLSAGTLRGATVPTEGHIATLNVSDFWSHDGGELPPVFPPLSAPWNGWQFDITAQSGTLALPGAVSTFDLHLGGTGAAPELAGNIAFQEVAFVAGDVLMPHGKGTATWRDGEVVIDGRATGELHECEFTAHLLGPIAKPLRFFEFAPPLTETLLNNALAGRYRAIPSLETVTRFAFHAPSALIGDVPVFEWTIIETPPPADERAQ